MGNGLSRSPWELPQDALKHVMLFMEPDALFLFSLCSKRSGGQVKSLNLRDVDFGIQINSAIIFELTISNILRFTVYFLFDDEPRLTENGQRFKNMERIRRIHVFRWERDEVDLNDVEISSPMLPLKGWIAHFLNIYNRSTIASMSLDENECLFDNAMLRETFKRNNITRLCFSRLPMNMCHVYVSYVFPQATELQFTGTPHTSTEFFHKIVVQNLEFLCFSNIRISLKVQDLTFIRIPQIEWFGCSLTVKEVNQFIKLWMAGENIELEHFCFIFEQGVIINEEAVLEGVDYRRQGIRDMRNKMIRGPRGQRNYLPPNGLIIQRQDMIEATISVYTLSMPHFIRFVVWN